MKLWHSEDVQGVEQGGEAAVNIAVLTIEHQIATPVRHPLLGHGNGIGSHTILIGVCICVGGEKMAGHVPAGKAVRPVNFRAAGESAHKLQKASRVYKVMHLMQRMALFPTILNGVCHVILVKEILKTLTRTVLNLVPELLALGWGHFRHTAMGYLKIVLALVIGSEPSGVLRNKSVQFICDILGEEVFYL